VCRFVGTFSFLYIRSDSIVTLRINPATQYLEISTFFGLVPFLLGLFNSGQGRRSEEAPR